MKPDLLTKTPPFLLAPEHHRRLLIDVLVRANHEASERGHKIRLFPVAVPEERNTWFTACEHCGQYVIFEIVKVWFWECVEISGAPVKMQCRGKSKEEAKQ